MKRLICIFTAVLSAGFAEAQFGDLGVTVAPDGTLTYPAAAVFRSKNDIAAKSDIPQLKNLTVKDGVEFANGDSAYNGLSARTLQMDKTYILAWINSLKRDFKLFIDTTQSQQSLSLISKTKTASNPFYYKDSEGKAVRTVNSGGSAMGYYTSSFNIPNIQYWTDCEIKVIDKWGNLIYFTSTIALENLQVQMLHPTLTDKTPKVYYWETAYQNATGGCWGTLKQLTNLNRSIGAIKTSNSCVSGIWIYPSLDSTEKRTIPIFTGTNTYTNKQVVWGEYVRSVFDNPENTVLCWRQTTSYGEIYSSGKIWRPVRIEYYGDFKEIK